MAVTDSSPAAPTQALAEPAPWLALIGIGEDGIAGLSGAARALIEGAELVAGGPRHLALASDLIRGEWLPWPSPISDAYPALLARRGRPVAVLASGDPFWYGIGATLARHVPAAEIVAIPAPSCLSLACARLGWALQDVSVVSFCGRPLERLAPLLQPGARILALSADAATPAAVAAYLTEKGFGPSRLHVLEALGGPRSRVRETTAAAFALDTIDPLNLLAIEAESGPEAQIIPLASGLPDDLFEHDGQITKREIRAVTLSTLSPRAGERLWDVGCGSGSIGIEWLLRSPANRAVGIDRHPERAARAARNAARLGVPHLEIATGAAPDIFDTLPRPDAVFVGGGTGNAIILDGAWAALKPGGRIVANAVTIEAEAALIAALDRFGGALTRLSVARLDGIGSMRAFRPAMTVTQWSAAKP
jgi:precorrin-6Y C5,15-methyltransferase (decarboxylating)